MASSGDFRYSNYCCGGICEGDMEKKSRDDSLLVLYHWIHKDLGLQLQS